VGTGPVDHFIDRRLILVPFFPVAVILFGNLPFFIRIIFTVFEAFKLFVFIDLKPELDDYGSKIGQVFLHIVYFTISPLPIGRRAKSLHPFNQDSAVPGPVEYGHVTGFWNMVPESPEVMVALFGFSRGADRDHFIASRIEVLSEPADIASLSGRVPAFE
jgi:hypothetical protein